MTEKTRSVADVGFLRGFQRSVRRFEPATGTSCRSGSTTVFISFISLNKYLSCLLPVASTQIEGSNSGLFPSGSTSKLTTSNKMGGGIHKENKLTPQTSPPQCGSECSSIKSDEAPVQIY